MIATQTTAVEEPKAEVRDITCVFDGKTECPIRKIMQMQNIVNQATNPIQNPMEQGFVKLMRMAIPQEIGFLHYYCALCTNAPVNKEPNK